MPISTITTYLLYEDVAKAIEWLVHAFGFTEVLRFTEDDGVVSHAEVAYGDSRVMLGHPGPEFRGPNRSGAVSVYTYVLVDDVDEHYRTAAAHGAGILLEPRDQPYGVRRYDATDPQGHRWMFAQTLDAIAPEAWGAVRPG